MALPFIEIIEWVEHDPNLLLWKFPDSDREIKNGAKLIVRESQGALLLNEGQLADVFGAGTHSLETRNVPLLSSLKGWKYGFKSPFKADVYFLCTRLFTALKWGTPAPVMMRDPQFGQVRVRAFGSYTVRITDAAKFFRQYAGTFPQLTIMELECQLRDFIAPKFGEALATANISVLDVAGNNATLNEKISPLIQPYFYDFGLEVTRFTVTSVTLPEEVTQYYDKVTGMNMVTDMNKFQQFNTAVATSQPGTAANSGLQQGVAIGMMMNQAQQHQQPQAIQQSSIEEKLQKLKSLFDAGLIDEAEYKLKKASLLENL